MRVGYARVPVPSLRRLEILHGGLLVESEDHVAKAILDHLTCALGTGEIDLICSGNILRVTII